MDIEEITLQKLCLQVIIHNFSKFATAYRMANCQENNLQFLRKFYSRKLLEEFIDQDKLQEEYLDFLLNEYVKKVDIVAILLYTSKENLISKLIPIAHSLDVLSCSPSPHLSDEMDEDYIAVLEQIIPHAKSVREMKLKWLTSSFNEDMVKLVAASCPQLTWLNISYSGVLGESLRSFYTYPDGSIKAKCPLKLIKLKSYEKIDGEEIAGLLENMPTLEEVQFPRLPRVLHSIHQKNVDNKCVNREYKKFNLTRLDFYPPDLDHLKSCSEICPNVRKIKIFSNTTRDVELRNLFPKLEDFYFEGSIESSTVNLNSVLKVKGENLKALSLKRCALSISVLIENCTNLETLTLTIVQCQKMDKPVSKVVNRLINLKLCCFDFLNGDKSVDSVMSLLNSSPDLEFLSFIQCNSFESNICKELNAYFSNCKIKKLEITLSNSISFETVQQFVLSCSSLKYLCLSCNSCFEDEKNILKLSDTIMTLKRRIRLDCDL